jgi:ribulose 1,5-bisphosphate synthetase/thiazole synthase
LIIRSRHDVIIVGGGTAGVAAAVAARRNGADAILIERYGFLGGTMTAGLVNPFMTFHAGEEQIIQGIFQEILDRLESLNGYDERTKAFDNEVMKLVTDQMVMEAGVKLLLHTYVVDAIMQENTIRGVEIYNKSGRQAILGKVVVDASGDGDVAVMAGAVYEKGRKEDGLTQPMTLNFKMGGVDVEKMPAEREINRLFEEAKSKGKVRIPRENVLWFPTIRKGEVHFNTTRVVKADGTKVEDLTYAEVEGRRQMVELVRFLKEKVSGFEDAYLLMSGTQIGIRETRRIIGEYVLTGEDIVEAKKFKDVVARGSYPIDIHSPTGEGTVIKSPPFDSSYDIPFRCLVPKRIDNLLIAGRCVSGTHEAQAAIRVIPIVVAIGQAAGTAAALAARLDTPPRELDVSLLQKTLRDQGANLG